MNNKLKSGETNPLGTLSHYNGLIFGNFTATQADCEGALAVGGVAKVGSPGYAYDIGGAGMGGVESVMIGTYKNPDGFPSLLLGGSVSSESTSANVHSGPLALRSGYQQEYENGPIQLSATSVQYHDNELMEVFFSTAKTQVNNTGDILLNASEKKIPLSTLKELNRLDQKEYLSTLATDLKILIYTIDCGDDEPINIGEIDFDSYIQSYDAIVFNIPAEIVTFSNGAILYEGKIVDTSLPQIYEGNKMVALLGSKVIFNLPNAETVTLNNYGITGSVLAPKAKVSGKGGSINGMLIADSLYQDGGMELHGFRIATGDLLWELEPEAPVGTVKVLKTDSVNKDPLEDALFALYEYDPETKQSELVTSGTTDPDGELIFYGLESGWYRLVEISAPDHYDRPKTNEWLFELTLNEKGDVTQLEPIYIQNTLAKGVVTLYKQDYSNHSTDLEGAVFSLYKFNETTNDYGLLREGLATDSEGVLRVTEVPLGQNKLLKTQAPTGYYLPEDYSFSFTVEMDGEEDVRNCDDIIAYNQLLASVELVKVDADNADKFLQGAAFTLYKRNEETDAYEVIQTGFITDTKGQITITGLEPGDYKLTETAPPEGYKLPDDPDTLFTISVDNEKRLNQLPIITVTNKHLGSVQVYKVDADDEKTYLEGAVFTLQKKNAETDVYEDFRIGLVTDSNGSLLIQELELGDYQLVETKSPDGYLLPVNTPVKFTVE